MKKLFIPGLLILFSISFGCSPAIVDNGPEVVELTDTSLTNPDFNAFGFTPTISPEEFSLSKTSTGVSLFYCYSGYYAGGIYEVKLSATGVTAETLIESATFQIPSISAVYDQQNNIAKLSFFYEYTNTPGGWDWVMTGNYSNGNLQMFSTDDLTAKKVSIAVANEQANKYFVFTMANNYIKYKTITVTGATTQTFSPGYVSGTGNSILLYDNQSNWFREFRSTHNSLTSKTLIGANFIGANSNYYWMIDENGPIGSTKKIYKHTDGYTLEFDMVPIDEYFLIAYESDLNISQQNNGNKVLTGEHVRLALINSTGNNEDLNLGSNNPAYAIEEKAIALPQTIGSLNEVGKICLAKKNNSEVGLSFIRDGRLYFTRIVYNQNKLSISPIIYIDEDLDPSYNMQMKMYWDGVYHIVYYEPLAGMRIYVSS